MMMPALIVTAYGQATVILEEGFEDITILEAENWILTNQSEPVGSTSWFQGNETVFPSHEGPGNAYIGANFNSTTGAGNISTWMIIPALEVKDGDVLSFYSRVPDGSSWNDRLEVRMSRGEMELPLGQADVGTFETILLIINDDLDLSYPEEWTQFEIVLDGLGTDPVEVNFAFRYNILNGGPNGAHSNYIGIDSLLIESSNVVGIDDNLQTVFSYYPNPTSNLLNIEANKNIDSIGVYNLLGQEVMNIKDFDTGQINLSHLASGNYMVKATFEDGSKEVFKVAKL